MKLPQKLFHYSAEPLTELRQNFHDLHRQEIPSFMKPHGFWLSVEDYEDDQNWFTWSQQEEFRLEALKHKYLISLQEDLRILWLKTSDEIEEFSLKYKANNPKDFDDFREKFAEKYSVIMPPRKPYIYMIHWDIIMKEYDGIIIAPYQWSCRLMNSSTSWYYGWDCASGCIWNIDKIKSFELINQEEPCTC